MKATLSAAAIDYRMTAHAFKRRSVANLSLQNGFYALLEASWAKPVLWLTGAPPDVGKHPITDFLQFVPECESAPILSVIQFTLEFVVGSGQFIVLGLYLQHSCLKVQDCLLEFDPDFAELLFGFNLVDRLRQFKCVSCCRNACGNLWDHISAGSRM